MRTDLAGRLRADAREADELHRRSRRLLVSAVRDATAAGLSQREIAAAIGRSQPEVSRLLRFHSGTPLGRAIMTQRAAILRLFADAGATNVRVFGSTARGEDRTGSDIDLMADFSVPPSLFELAHLEREVSRVLDAKVDISPAAALRANVAESALGDAVPI